MRRCELLRASLLRLLILAACAASLRLSAAIAQINPDDMGEGTKLGLAQKSNSGQVGTVTLFARAPHVTLVVLALESVPPGSSETALIRRGRSCDASPVDATSARLAPVQHGTSRTLVSLPAARLLSGNYVIEAFGAAGRRVSCGELHH